MEHHSKGNSDDSIHYTKLDQVECHFPGGEYEEANFGDQSQGVDYEDKTEDETAYQNSFCCFVIGFMCLLHFSIKI